MTKYIEREAAMLTPVLPKTHRQYQTDNLDDACECGWYDALSNLKNLPAADVAPVVHGKWIEKTFLMGTSNFCSLCGCHYGMPHEKYNFCPNCGARMDGGAVDEP